MSINEFSPFIHLIYAQPAFQLPKLPDIQQRIAVVSGLAAAKIRIELPDHPFGHFSGNITYDEHKVLVSGLLTPLPQPIIDRTIHLSHWPAQIRAAMRHHQSHLSLIYTGKVYDPVRQMSALYTVAHALADENLLGIVNEQAWTAHPPADFLLPEKIRSYQTDLPFLIWVGYIKFFLDKQNYWFVTKGHHIFDIPDLATFIGNSQDTAEVMDQFITIFHYLYNKDVTLTAGDTMEIQPSDQILRFTEVTEYPEFLMGPSGTLVVEPITPDQVNPAA